jgi:hypothetical protein
MRSLAHAARTPEIAGALQQGLTDGDAWVRYYACQSIGKLHVTSATEQIEARLDDAAGQVRVAAVESIARLGGDRALAALRHASLSSDPDVRRAALTGLGRIRRPDAFALLLRAAESEDPTTRLVATSAIGESTSPDAVAGLIRAGADSDERVRGAAFNLLAMRPGLQATRWLIERLAVETDRERALSALASPVDGRIEGILSALETADGSATASLIGGRTEMQRPSRPFISTTFTRGEPRRPPSLMSIPLRRATRWPMRRRSMRTPRCAESAKRRSEGKPVQELTLWQSSGATFAKPLPGIASI